MTAARRMTLLASGSETHENVARVLCDRLAHFDLRKLCHDDLARRRIHNLCQLGPLGHAPFFQRESFGNGSGMRHGVKPHGSDNVTEGFGAAIRPWLACAFKAIRPARQAWACSSDIRQGNCPKACLKRRLG